MSVKEFGQPKECTLEYRTYHRLARSRSLAGGALISLLLLCNTLIFAEEPTKYNIGRPATSAEIAAWDSDVRPDGTGLPAGQGNAIDGKVLYASKCQSCHGVDGVGGTFGSLVGRLPDDGFPFGREGTIPKTVGNYWPFATTLFDYIRRAMPFDAPGSLDSDEVYSLVAYLLNENKIIESGIELDKNNLANIRMPARDRFVPDDRQGGNEVR